jgi:hypothetical protein
MHVALRPTAIRGLLVVADHPPRVRTAGENARQIDISPVYRRLRAARSASAQLARPVL